MARFPNVLTDLTDAGLIRRDGSKYTKTLDGKQAA